MMQKRMNKLESAVKDWIPPKVWGDKKSQVGIIGVGSTFGPIQEAIAQLQETGDEAKYLQMRTLWPFPRKKVEEFLVSCKEIYVVENNFSGQLSQLIRSQVQVPFEAHKILKYSGQAFRPQEISAQIKKGHS
jgi:2-oxoglutarate ferredoxin oxidoreductase subunit alpha